MPELKENHTKGTASTSFPGPGVVTGVSLHIAGVKLIKTYGEQWFYFLYDF